jgi:hypothetical protein
VESEVDWKVEEKDVNISAGDQLTEHFLSEVNPVGFASMPHPTLSGFTTSISEETNAAVFNQVFRCRSLEACI